MSIQYYSHKISFALFFIASLAMSTFMFANDKGKQGEKDKKEDLLKEITVTALEGPNHFINPSSGKRVIFWSILRSR